jgi:hypothetical protein
MRQLVSATIVKGVAKLEANEKTNEIESPFNLISFISISLIGLSMLAELCLKW